MILVYEISWAEMNGYESGLNQISISFHNNRFRYVLLLGLFAFLVFTFTAHKLLRKLCI